MPTPRFDDRQIPRWLSRLVPPAIAWAALFAFFAVAGWMSLHASMQAAGVAASSGPMAGGVALQTTSPLASTRPSEPLLPDPAIAAHEELDPVGAGHALP